MTLGEFESWLDSLVDDALTDGVAMEDVKHTLQAAMDNLLLYPGSAAPAVE